METLYSPRKSTAHVKHEVNDFYGLGTSPPPPQDSNKEDDARSTTSTQPSEVSKLPPVEIGESPRPCRPLKNGLSDGTEKPKEKSSFRKSLSNFLTPPATKSYNKVLASTYQQQNPSSTSGPVYQHSTLSSEDSLARKKEEAKELTDEEKAKRLVAERDASSPTGNFLLGVYKPLSASQGYEDYYTAKGMTGK